MTLGMVLTYVKGHRAEFVNLLLNEEVDFVTQKRLEYLEGSHDILLCATEKV